MIRDVATAMVLGYAFYEGWNFAVNLFMSNLMSTLAGMY